VSPRSPDSRGDLRTPPPPEMDKTTDGRAANRVQAGLIACRRFLIRAWYSDPAYSTMRTLDTVQLCIGCFYRQRATYSTLVSRAEVLTESWRPSKPTPARSGRPSYRSLSACLPGEARARLARRCPVNSSRGLRMRSISISCGEITR